ncbi:MAG: SDR family oxidoreductase [Ignavibacteriae bacterium]|nr:SDR family oxidoreductase [Ignavibacteriota bacterium]
MTNGIAIIGIGCYYPDARSPKEFWENILAQRRAFRRMPDERLPLSEYWSTDRNEPDKTYSPYAALIHGFEFDRIRYRIAGSTFRATDIAQWLALQIAEQALKDAGYVDVTKLPRDTTGIILGNTLTGEISRANTLRLRWPYVQKVLRKTLSQLGVPSDKQAVIIAEAEKRYKSAFPPINHENLAGGLSNTIPGRICNHFDFHGGGYTVDGACAASLLAVTTACAALESHDMDVTLAGGVDISLDPFELVGFSKMGALAEHEMFVYDEHSNGFLPGEGCGIVVLKRLEDAITDGNRIYAVIRGWGVSSDGQGGLTTPSISGQAFAVRRAYKRAGYGLHTVPLIEGHGTGTTVGDKIELAALASVVAESLDDEKRSEFVHQIAVGSIKANIGHTKAAAGIAGLIKSTLALYHQIMPPTPGSIYPHKEFQHEAKSLYPLRKARLWEKGKPLRAGISAFGFGGINTHITLESLATDYRSEVTPEETRIISSKQDSEVFFFATQRSDELKALIEKVYSFAHRLSQAELADLAAALAQRLTSREVRAAIVASRPEELHQKLQKLLSILVNSGTAKQFSYIDTREGIFLARGVSSPKIGFLYPGQGIQQLNMSLPWYERYDFIRATFELAARSVGWSSNEKLSEYIFKDIDRATPAQIDSWRQLLTQTEIAQPAIVAVSAVMTKVLSDIGIVPSLAIGYSLGEWSALWSADVLSEGDLFRCVAVRGQAMAAKADVKGAMATIAASADDVEKLISKVPGYLMIAGYNTPKQVVISGETEAVQKFIALAREQNIPAIALKVSNAFHSHLVSSAAEVLRRELKKIEIFKPSFTVVSTVSADEVDSATVKENLCKQILQPVRFMDAIQKAKLIGIDVFVEVGPGHSLGSMVTEVDHGSAPTVLYTDDEGGTSFRSFNITMGCLFALGAPMKIERLFEARFTRPLSLDYNPSFLRSPCESDEPELILSGDVEKAAGQLGEHLLSEIPLVTTEAVGQRGRAEGEIGETRAKQTSDYDSVLNIVLDLAAEITEYPRESIKSEHLLLRDLNLNSIASAQLVAEAARRLNLPRPVDPTEYAAASLQMVATTLFELLSTQGVSPAHLQEKAPAGISSWVRSFTVEMKEEILPSAQIRHLKEGDWCLVVSKETHPFTTVFVDRLVAQGVDVELFSAQAPEEQFEALFSSEQDFDAVIMILPHTEPSDVWDIEPQELTLRFDQVAQPVFMVAKYFARWFFERKQPECFFGVVQYGGGMFGRGSTVPEDIDLACGSGLLKSLFLELNLPAACIIDLSPGMDSTVAANTTLIEFQRSTGFVEVGYTNDGTRRVPVMKLLEAEAYDKPVLTKDDVLLVTGGGRGIAAHCALSLARETGCKVALLGRTQLDDVDHHQSKEEVKGTIERFKAAKIVCRYDVCDVSDPDALRSTIDTIERTLGSITAVLHAAGTNIPQATRNLTWEAVDHILAPKVHGTVNLLRALKNNHVKLFMTFGSIIAQTGMRGEVAYAFANEWMNLLILRAQEVFPKSRFLSLNWSVWSGTGMGERLGSVDALMHEGITPIEPAQGISELLMLINSHCSTPEILVTGRLGDLPTRTFADGSLPLYRFLENKRVYYPGIELICECELSADNDPYLKDHVFPQRGGSPEGMQLFPTVFGIEAMIQLASVLTGNQNCTTIEKLELSRPIMVSSGGKTTIRIIAQRQKERPHCVDVAIRSVETNFTVDHFRGRCVFGELHEESRETLPGLDELLPLNPQKDLYGSLLFQGPMFQHLVGYRELNATHCLAEIECPAPQELFGRYYPQAMITGDPTVRDVFLHAIQPCVPQKNILPLSIKKIRFVKPWAENSRLILHAVERERSENEYTYDVHVFSTKGEVVEILEGFRCRAVGKSLLAGKDGMQSPLPLVLLSSYLERELQLLLPKNALSIAFDCVPISDQMMNEQRYQRRKESTRKALRLAVRNLLSEITKTNVPHNTSFVGIVYGNDGKPNVELSGEFKQLSTNLNVSVTHIHDSTLAFATLGVCACDMEVLQSRSNQAWKDLLGTEGLQLAAMVGHEMQEAEDASRTRVWTIIECLKKAGISRWQLPIFESVSNGWVVCRLQQNGDQLAVLTQRLSVHSNVDITDVIAALLLSPVARPDAVDLKIGR